MSLITVAEAAQELRCSKLTIYRAVSDGRLEARRLGENGPIRIARDELDHFLVPVRADAARQKEPVL